MKCEVPVGWTCKFESALSSDQLMQVLGGIGAIIVLIILVAWFVIVVKD